MKNPLHLALPLLLALVACDSSDGTEGTLRLDIDPTLAPAQPAIDGRPIGRMVGEGGVAMDFFLGELVLVTDDTGKLDTFVKRWGATVTASSEPAPGVPRLHHVKLDPSPAVVADLLGNVNRSAKDAKGRFRSSSDAGAKLLAVALAEANALGITVSPNFVMTPAGIADGTSAEAPTGEDATYSPNAFAWPYMNLGSAQSTGVGAAWQAMARAGKIRADNRVKMMIVDAGFAPNADFPDRRQVIGDWNVPNGANCSGGNPCPWHGTMVTSAAMGTLDDGQGGAGPAAPVGDLVAVPIGGDVFGVLSSIVRVISGLARDDIRIINVSSSFNLDLGWDVAVKVACLGLCPSLSEAASGISAAVTASNKLIFASAGNAGVNVDDGGPERSTTMPCELFGVVCVGGLAHNVAARDPSSNFGTKRDDDSVDIYGPFWTWVGTDPDNRDNRARLVAGTSFSSPFVAGVAALVWASNPGLRAPEVWATLRDTAFVGGVGDGIGNPRRINALGAVERVLAGAAPTITLATASPTAPLNGEISVTAVVDDDGARCSPTACPVEWSPAPLRTVGHVAYFRFAEVGPKTLTATTRDPGGQRATATTSVTVDNQPPAVSILAPTASTTVYQNVATQLLGSALDPNEAGPLACTWTSSVGTDTLTSVSCNTNATFTTTGSRTLTLRATDPQGASSTATVTINVLPAPANLPPVITATGLTPSTPNFNGDGYFWTTPLAITAGAIDPENNVPITYTWRATSLRPNSTTPYASNVVVGTSASLAWTPNSTPSLLGDFGALGNDCYSGQVVQLRLEARDSLGNTATRSFSSFKVYRCSLD